MITENEKGLGMTVNNDDEFWEDEGTGSSSLPLTVPRLTVHADDIPGASKMLSDDLEKPEATDAQDDAVTAPEGDSDASESAWGAFGKEGAVFYPSTRWRVLLPRDAEGKRIKGKKAQENPAVFSLLFSDGEDYEVERSIMLTPAVAKDMHEALSKVLDSYEVKPKFTLNAQSRDKAWKRVIDWHKKHKFLAVCNTVIATVILGSLLVFLLNGLVNTI